MKTTSPFYRTGVSKSPLYDKGHPGDEEENHHGSYEVGDIIDETDFEKAGSKINVQDVNIIQSDKKSQFIVTKTGEESPFVNPSQQDTIRPPKTRKFQKGYNIKKMGRAQEMRENKKDSIDLAITNKRRGTNYTQ